MSKKFSENEAVCLGTQFAEFTSGRQPTAFVCPCVDYEKTLRRLFASVLLKRDVIDNKDFLEPSLAAVKSWNTYASLSAAKVAVFKFLLSRWDWGNSDELYDKVSFQYMEFLNQEQRESLEFFVKLHGISQSLFSPRLCFIDFAELRHRYANFKHLNTSRAVLEHSAYLDSAFAVGSPIALLGSEVPLRIKQGANEDLQVFEMFLKDVDNAGVGLIVFGIQSLYDGENSTIERVLTPDYNQRVVQRAKAAAVHNTIGIMPLLKQGAQDRLLFALEQGQRLLTSR